jgi:hypothetical protein
MESRRSLYEELAEQSLGFLEPLVGQQHRFGFARNFDESRPSFCRPRKPANYWTQLK